MSPEDLKKLEDLGVTVLGLPKVYDEISLFDFMARIMMKLSLAVGGPGPTYDQVYTATKKARKNFDF